MMATQIYRHKFSPEFINEMKKFIEIHRFDEVLIFKEAWEKWYIENIIYIKKEERRLEGRGYTGDIRLKMYKSARYYYKNKSLEETKPKKRTIYIRIDNTLLQLMDSYLEKNKEKPSIAYENFIHLYAEEIKAIQKELLLKYSLSNEISARKIKKTFKNRYFRMDRK